jgi:hypothetical protein
MDNNLHLEVLPEDQRLLLQKLAKEDWLGDFYLAGGTALALQIGHRESIDFDFFSKKEFGHQEIIQKLERIGSFELFQGDEGTINGRLSEIRISFFYYKYKIVEDPIVYEKLNIANKLDIALMKLEAISGRGSRKDFIDLYFLLREFSLERLYSDYPLKYGQGLDNKYHLLKSLAYFEDAEKEPMPKMLISIDWEKIKSAILKEVGTIEQNILKE